VTRAIRTANRSDHGLDVVLNVRPGQGGAPVVLALLGSEDVEAEKLIAHEVGARFHPSDRLSVDLSAFSNVYHDLIGTEGGDPFLSRDPLPPHMVIPLRFANNLTARTKGLEIAGQWRVTDRWRLACGGALFDADIRGRASGGRPPDTSRDENSPEQMLHLRSSLDLPNRIELDALYYRVSRLEGSDIPGYSRLDIRLGWRPSDRYEVSVGVQNLLGEGHREFASASSEHPSPVERRIYGKLIWRR
jgi:iron complex outermembrane receptor protein